MKKSNKGFEWSFRDWLISMMVVFMAFAIVSLASVVKPTEQGVNAGSIIIEMQWPVNSPVDVDLWIKEPQDEKPVGYIRHTGDHCDLIHDDLGPTSTIESRNQEFIVCRSIPVGEYIINAVAYDTHGPETSYPVQVSVKVKVLKNNQLFVIATSEGLLKKKKDEITLLRFNMDNDGLLVYNSINRIPKLIFSNISGAL